MPRPKVIPFPQTPEQLERRSASDVTDEQVDAFFEASADIDESMPELAALQLAIVMAVQAERTRPELERAFALILDEAYK